MENLEPIGGLSAGWCAAIALMLWLLTGAMLLTLGLTLGLLLMLLGGALLATLGSALGTIVEAGRNRDWLSASGLLVVFVLALVALDALALNGLPVHTFVSALYGFSPDFFAFHPFAFGASFALLVLPALAALAYSVLYARARRVSSLVSLAWMVAAIGLLVAIRLVPASSLPS